MENYSDLGIPLKSVRFSERDKIVTLLTHHHGKVSVLAKNSVHSKRFGATLDHFHASQFEWKDFANGSRLATLSSAVLRKSFTQFPLQWPLHLAGASITETLLQIAPENAPCPELFSLYSHALLGLEEASGHPTSNPPDHPSIKTEGSVENQPNTIAIGKWIHFHLKLLEKQGHGLQLNHCVLCEKKEAPPFAKDNYELSLQTFSPLHQNARANLPSDEALLLLNPLGWTCDDCKKGKLLRYDLSLQHRLPRQSLKWLSSLENTKLSEPVPSAGILSEKEAQNIAILAPLYDFFEKAVLSQISAFSAESTRAKALTAFRKWIESEAGGSF